MSQNYYAQTSKATSRFIRGLLKIPILTKEEELRLALKWHNEKDIEALHSLVGPYEKLVFSMARKFKNYGLPLSDLIQEGVLGLMVAAERFDPYRDIRFATYAKWWIRSSIQDYILRNWSIVRTGTTTAQKQLFFNLKRLRAQITDISNQYMSDEEKQAISVELSVHIKDVEAMEQRTSGSDFSLNVFVGGDTELTWQDTLPDDSASPEDSLCDKDEKGAIKELIQEGLRTLDARERKIIKARRLSESPPTLQALARRMNLSKERVRQIEAKSMRKLKQYVFEQLHGMRRRG
jgi:RNA polymerase sigma-32 factor